MDKLKKFLGAEPFDNVILRLLSALCLSAMVLSVPAGFAFNDISAYAGIGLTDVGVSLAVCFLLMTVVTFFARKKDALADKKALFILFLFYAVTTVMASKNYYYTFGICALFAVLIYYYNAKGYTFLSGFSKKKTITVIAVSVGVFALLSGTYLVLRVVNLQAPNYDFGIFCQMFHNMRSCFQPLTTVERDGLLSHFSVHMSLIYYLVLPIYAVFPFPVTLQLTQVAALSSAALPVYFLCRKYELSELKTALLTLCVMFHPALFGGGSYDFHENCFLIPLLLWMFYFFEKEKYVPMAVFAALTCFVKEDAPVYVVFFAVWIFAARKKKAAALLLGAGAVIYFVGVLAYMSKYGNGIMANRYGNYLCSPDDSLFSAIKNVLADPAYVFTQIFVDGDGAYAAKLLFILQIFVPFAFLPFCVKKVSNLILLFPVLLINLMSLYVYQYDISFQYVYGPLPFVIYLAIINASETDSEKCAAALKIGALSSALLLMTFYVPKTMSQIDYRGKTGDDLRLMTEYLETIPENASVCASTMLIPKLSERDVLYEDFYHEPGEGEILDYILIDGRYDKQKFLDKYEALGYEITYELKNEAGKTLITVLTYPGE